MLYIQGKWITRDFESQIEKAATTRPMEEYIEHRFGISSYIRNMIDWPTIGRVRKSMKQSQRIRGSKLMYGWLPVGHNSAKTGALSDVCPCCGTPDETLEHLFICTNPELTLIKTNGIREAVRKCSAQNLPNRVTLAFFDMMLDYINGRDTHIQQDMHPTIKRAIQSQQQIGIHLFSRGFITKEWRTALDGTNTQYPQHKTEVLLKSLWTSIFESMWTCRNNILHNQSNFRTIAEDDELVRKLRWYQTHQRDAFSANHRHFADIHLDDVHRWTLQTKRAYIILLNTAHRSRMESIKNSTKKSDKSGRTIQRILPEFFRAQP